MTTLDVSLATRRHTSKILRDVRSGKLKASKVGRDVLWSREQFDAAVAFYAAQDRTWADE